MVYESFNHTLLKHVPAHALRMLDLGCGTGSLGGYLRDQRSCEVVGITHSKAEARIASARLDQVIVADLDNYIPEHSLGKFDVVVCSHVLEHLLEPTHLLHSAALHLKVGGRLIVALPNVLHWKQRLLFLRGHFNYTLGGIMDSTHLHFYDWENARQLVADAGLRILHAEAPGNLPLPVVRKLLPSRLSSALDLLATARYPGLFGAQFVIVAEPVATEVQNIPPVI